MRKFETLQPKLLNLVAILVAAIGIGLNGAEPGWSKPKPRSDLNQPNQVEQIEHYQSLPPIARFSQFANPASSFGHWEKDLSTQITQIHIAQAQAEAIKSQPYAVPLRDRQGQTYTLEARLYLPTGTPPYPLVIINHGSPRNPDSRQHMSSSKLYTAASQWFASQGYAVIVPLRRGYGGSEGKFAEGFKSCQRPDYAQAGLATAEDILGVVADMQKQDFIDRHRIIIVGQSAGGWGAIAAASYNPQGVLGVINFAGGRGSYADDKNCSFPALIEAAAKFGQTARIPTLWIYTENDRYFNPNLARQMFAQFSQPSPAEDKLLILSAFRQDGHSLFSSKSGLANWTGKVASFLQQVDPVRSNRVENPPPKSICSITTADGRVIDSPLLCLP
jgi:dienelactone hydrolase